MDFVRPSAPHVCQISKTYFNWKTGNKGVHFLTAIWDTWWRSTFVKCRADFRLALSQWETSLQSDAVSNLLDANLESALKWLVVVASGVSDPGMHHGTCVTHVPWCMSGSLYSLLIPRWCNTLVPGLNGLHFTDDILNILFLNENTCILTDISLKVVTIGLIDIKSSLVQAMVWWCIGN